MERLKKILSILVFIKNYIYNIFIALDQLVNALALGDPDETISSRVGRRWPNSRAARIINAVFFWQKNHVIEAIESDEGNNDLL